jgi:thiol-disulfide isomerase/thioredoxin
LTLKKGLGIVRVMKSARISFLVAFLIVGLAAIGGALTGYLYEQRSSSVRDDGGDDRGGLNLTPMGSFSVHDAPLAIPDLTFQDATGAVRHLSEWRGKLVLLNLWATWCAPCKVEMPELAQLQTRLGGDGFTVLALSVDRTGPKAPKAFLEKEALAALQFYNDDTAEASVKLKVPGLPTSILIGPDGKEIARLLGTAKWTSEKMIGFIQGRMPKSG